MSRIGWPQWGGLLVLLLLPFAGAHAHKPSDSYLTLRVSEARIEGQWDIALRDLEYALGLDANGDGDITWGELKARHVDIAHYVLARLSLRAEGKACTLQPTAHLVDEHSDGAYAVLRFEADCGAVPRVLEAGYSLFFDFDAQHKGLLRMESAAGTRTAIFSSERPEQTFTLESMSWQDSFVAYTREGIWHIWIGIDHVLFILSLLLPSVLFIRAGRWQAASRFAPAFWDVVRIVTSFTVAHSITLSLAALGWIALPSRLVESTIAASVVVAALNNVRPLVLESRWLVAFVFGLIHGFGFASVLGDLGLRSDALLVSLVGFNVGVELGQLAIVLIFVPLAFMMRESRFYRTVVMIGGSSIIALIALVWLVERAFDLKILG